MVANSLQLKTAQTQSLVLSPQMQQAIKLLHLSALELIEEIQKEVDTNPMLEMEESEMDKERVTQLSDSGDFDPFDNDQHGQDIALSGTSDSLSFEEKNKDDIASIDSDLPYQKEYYTDIAHSHKSYDGEDHSYEGETSASIHDHLSMQLELSPLTGKDKFIAASIIDAVDDSGYLSEDLSEILKSTKAIYEDTSLEEIEVVLKLVQHYDPLGVASRDLRECLLTQLKLKDQDDIKIKKAMIIVDQYLHKLSNKDFRFLTAKLKCSDSELKEYIAIIKSLNPRPAVGLLPQSHDDYIIPDLICYKDKNGDYVVELNNKAMPAVRINESYRSLMDQAKSKEEVNFFKSYLQEANFFIQSIEKRSSTLLSIASIIMKYQHNFLSYGPEFMVPLVLADISSEAQVHESTVSRLTNRKFIHTPRGTFELKYFFSSSVVTETGEGASATAIKACIQRIIDGEDKRKPLSDSKIVKLLEAEGLNVARRTIAKYREAIGIGPSNLRKQL